MQKAIVADTRPMSRMLPGVDSLFVIALSVISAAACVAIALR